MSARRYQAKYSAAEDHWQRGPAQFEPNHSACAASWRRSVFVLAIGCLVAIVFPASTFAQTPPTVQNVQQRIYDGVCQGNEAFVPEGGDINTRDVCLEALVTDPAPGDQVWLQVEVKPLGTSFDGTGLVCFRNCLSPGDQTTQVVTIHGLAYGESYHWRARGIDDQGGVGAWVEMGTAGNTDFSAVNLAPEASLLGQRIYDGVCQANETMIPEGGVSNTRNICVEARIADPVISTDTIIVQVEVKPVGTPFDETGIVCHISCSSLVSQGGIHQVTVNGLVYAESYHWRARGVDDSGAVGPWVELGTAGNTDFSTVNLAPTISQMQQRDYATYSFCSSFSDIVPEGGSIGVQRICAEAHVVDPVYSTDSVRLEVEVKPVGTAFTGTGLVCNPTCSTFGSQGGQAQVLVSGLAFAESYHWRARGVDDAGAASAWAEFGTPGNTDFTVVNDPPTISGLQQRDLPCTTSGTPIAEGATTGQQTVCLEAQVNDPILGESVRLELEVKPVATPFDGLGLVCSPTCASVGSQGTKFVPVTGLTPGDSYHWRARSVDSLGLEGQWVEFGTPGNTDFVVINRAPTISTLRQRIFDGQCNGNETLVPEGGNSLGTSICLGASISDPDSGDSGRLEVEVKPIGTAFDGTGVLCSPTCATTGPLGSKVVTASGLVLTESYHWRARSVDALGLTSAWTEFGTAGNTDFVVIENVDLVMASLGLGASSVAPGGTLSVTNTILNLGTAATTASSIEIGFYLSSDNQVTTSDTLIGTRSIAGLSGNSFDTASTPVTIPSPLAAGQYYIAAIADHLAQQPETNEENNTSSPPSSVTVSTLADLVETALSASPVSITAGDSITVSDTVCNQGTEDTGVGFTVGLYLSNDTIITPSDMLLGSRSVGALAPGGCDSASTPVTVDSATPAGAYYVGAVADTSNAVSETNETNNGRAGNTIDVTGLIDLVVTSVYPNVFASVVAGNSIFVDVTAENQGTAPSGAFSVTIRLSVNSVYGDADDIVTGATANFPSLDGGMNATQVGVVVTIPGTTPAADYFVCGMADEPGVISELNEGNNALCSGFPITVTTPVPLPPDTDQDGLSDDEEINIYFTLPNNPDTDGDGYGDGVEVGHGTIPTDDTDVPPPSAEYAYVADQEDGSLAVVNTGTREIVTRAALGTSDLCGVTVSPDKQYVYVADYNGYIAIVSTATHRELDQDGDPANGMTRIAVGIGPCFVAFLPDSSKAYVTVSDGLAVLDTSAFPPTLESTMSFAPDYVQSATVAPDGNALYVSLGLSTGGGALVQVNPATDQVVATYPFADSPANMAVSPDSQTVYVAAGSSIFILGPQCPGGCTVLRPEGPYGVVVRPDGLYAYFTTWSAQTLVLDTSIDPTSTDPVVAAIPMGFGYMPRTSTDGAFLYIAETDVGLGPPGGTLAVVDTALAVSNPGSAVVDRVTINTASLAGLDVATVPIPSIGPTLSTDLGISKTDSFDPVTVGNGLTYSILVTNYGPDNATGVTVTDSLPVGMAYLTATPSQGTCGEVAGTVTCDLGSLANGAVATITIDVTATSAGAIANTASVSGNESDPNASNNSATEVTTVNALSADVAISQSDSPDPVAVGSNLTYSITVTNNGPSGATGVTVTDLLPAQVSYVSSASTQGSCLESAGTVTCSIGSVGSGAGVSVTIVVAPNSAGPFSNTTNVTANESDPNGGNNSATTSTTAATVSPGEGMWTPTTTAGAPVGGYAPAGVWTGSRMIVWGGFLYNGSYNYLNTGGQYNPFTNSWTPTSTVGAPSGRHDHPAVWTGTEMIVWGGYTSSAQTNTGGRYNPATNTWSPTSTVGAPTARTLHPAVWTGTEILVWGGQTPSGTTNTGGRYNPASDSWTPMSTVGAPDPIAPLNDGAIWTGSEMIVWWGPSTSTSGRYNPATNTWAQMSTVNAPTARRVPLVWTGTEMIVWGGGDSAGARYNPVTDTWTPMSTLNAPSPRYYYGAVWTGTEFVVYGGWNGTANPLDGGRYNPLTDTWTPLPTLSAPTPTTFPVKVWTGNDFIVWGGNVGGWSAFATPQVNTGGRYTPPPADFDGDGFTDFEESIGGSDPGDALSIPTYAETLDDLGRTVRLVVPMDVSIMDFHWVDPSTLPSPPSGTFPYGMVSISLGVPSPGATRTVAVTFPGGVSPSADYEKYGATSGDPSDHWYNFPFGDNNGDATITLTLTDGGAGDHDLLPNNAIEDPGGPLVAPVSNLANISTRANVGTGPDVAVGGFIISGTGSKQVLIRGYGPTLEAAVGPGVLPDPVIELYVDHDNNPLTPAILILSNDDWQTQDPSCLAPLVACGTVQDIIDTGKSADDYAPTNPNRGKDAALLVTLPPGAYPVTLRGAGSSTGVGLIAINDIDATQTATLANISTRANVGTGPDVAVGGFIISGSAPKQVLLRGYGPTLEAAVGPGVLPDPVIELYVDHDNNPLTPAILILSNDDWQTQQGTCPAPLVACGSVQDIIDTGKSADDYAPTDPNRGKDAALLVTLPPGAYPVTLRGAGSLTGVGLIAVNEIGP